MSGGTYGDATYGALTYGGYAAADPEPMFVVQYLLPNGEWGDLTCDTRGLTIDRGRTTYSDSFRAGTLEVIAANPTGKYSTWPDTSVWRQPGGFVTDVPVRVGTVLAGDVDWRFVGTTDRVADVWPDTVDAAVVISATDAFKVLARYRGVPVAAVGAGELSGARVNRILAAARYTGPRVVDAGAVHLSATTLDGIAVDLLRQVGEAEWGWLYVRGDGTLAFRQRDAALTDPRMTTVQYLFTDTDAVAGACYGTATVVGADSDHVITTAQITPVGHAVTSTFEDAPAAAWYGPRTYNRADLPIDTDVDAAALAQLVVTTYRADARRIDAITFDAANQAGAWPVAHGAHLLDRVRFVRTLPGGWQIDAELLIQGRRDAVVPRGDGAHVATWDVTFATASALTVRGLGLWDRGRWDEAIWGV